MNELQLLNTLNQKLNSIEKKIDRLEEKMDFSLSIQRNHLMRVKNGEDIDDSTILLGLPYNDLTPHQALKIYNNNDLDFTILDVSDKDYRPEIQLKGTLYIPFESLESEYQQIQQKTLPILVISEKGLKSIKACELLVKKGYFNVNNVSGGYEFWPKEKSKLGNIEL